MDKSGLWVMLNDDPYNNAKEEQFFDALYFGDTRVCLLDEGARFKLLEVAPHLVEGDPEADYGEMAEAAMRKFNQQ